MINVSRRIATLTQGPKAIAETIEDKWTNVDGMIDHANGERRHDGEWAGPRHDMRRGEHLSDKYRSRQYVVDDWRGHRLRQPSRGYHWVQAGREYVLVTTGTGIIADILLNH